MSTSTSFLPENYTAPVGGSGQYFKPQVGENRVRIVSNPIIGWLYWNTEGKPVRNQIDNNPGAKPADMRQADTNGRAEKVKQFWAVKVFNYATKQMEVWEITQATIMGELQKLSKDEDWGHPKKYDLKISKSGSGLNTEYSITPVAPKPPTAEVIEAYKATPINLEALFDGGNPFGESEASARFQQAVEQKPADEPKKPVPSVKPKAQQRAEVAAAPVDPEDLPF